MDPEEVAAGAANRDRARGPGAGAVEERATSDEKARGGVRRPG